MNFEFSSDQMLLKDQARKFLESEESVKKAREVLEGQQTHDESLWKAVIEMGWTATTIPEEFDGLGLGYLELCVIAEELGRSLAPTPFSSSVYLATEALINLGSKEQKQNYIKDMTAQFENSEAVLVTHYQGLNMKQLDELRSIHESGKEYLDQILERETEKTKIPSLKISFNNFLVFLSATKNIYLCFLVRIFLLLISYPFVCLECLPPVSTSVLFAVSPVYKKLVA